MQGQKIQSRPTKKTFRSHIYIAGHCRNGGRKISAAISAQAILKQKQVPYNNRGGLTFQKTINNNLFYRMVDQRRDIEELGIVDH